MNSSVYEGLAIGEGGNRFKPDSPAFIDIAVSTIERKESSFKKKDGTPKEGLIYFGTDSDGVEREWAAFSANALRAVMAEKPQVGDLIRIEFLGERPVPGLNPEKLWKVTVLKRAGQVAGQAELDDSGLPVDF